MVSYLSKKLLNCEYLPTPPTIFLGRKETERMSFLYHLLVRFQTLSSLIRNKFVKEMGIT